ncbi:MAG: alpha/beta fold hydrolase [Bacteroidales bacterium]|nr:alpha/beta fold hydrolase [Bacteroidales bacterium]
MKVVLRDCFLNINITGDLKDPVVLLFPAMGRPANDFDDLTKFLSENGFSTISINPRGVNGSTGLTNEIEIKDIAHDILEIINQLNIEKLHVLGHAFGSRVARFFANINPERTQSTISITMGAVKPPKLPYPAISLDLLNENKIDTDIFKEVIKTAYFSKESNPEIWYEGWCTEAIYPYSLALARATLEEILPGGKTPMLIVQGVDDIFAPVTAGETMREIYGERIKLKNIKDAAHEILHEQPEQAFNAILEFLKEVENGKISFAQDGFKVKHKKQAKGYGLGWSDVMTRFQEKRTIQKYGAFFIPHLKEDMTLLDIGCGTGKMTYELAQYIPKGKITGIDISEKQIESANSRIKKNKARNINFKTGNVLNLEYSDETFDVVWCHTLLMHLKEPVEALKEISRILKKGGFVAVSDGDWDSDIIFPRFQIIEARKYINSKILKESGTNLNHGKKNASLLSDAGFQNIEASATIESYGTPTEVKELAEYAIAFEKERFSENSSELSLKMREEAWNKWSQQSGAFFARTHCQAIGWKN